MTSVDETNEESMLKELTREELFKFDEVEKVFNEYNKSFFVRIDKDG